MVINIDYFVKDLIYLVDRSRFVEAKKLAQYKAELEEEKSTHIH